MSMSEDVGLGALFDMHSEGVGRHWIKILTHFLRGWKIYGDNSLLNTVYKESKGHYLFMRSKRLFHLSRPACQ
jgi:hypothetical protein